MNKTNSTKKQIMKRIMGKIEDNSYRRFFEFLIEHYGHNKIRMTYPDETQLIKCKDCLTKIHFSTETSL